MIVEFFDICNGAAYKVITKDFKLTNIWSLILFQNSEKGLKFIKLLKTLSGNFYKKFAFFIVKVDKPLENA